MISHHQHHLVHPGPPQSFPLSQQPQYSSYNSSQGYSAPQYSASYSSPAPPTYLLPQHSYEAGPPTPQSGAGQPPAPYHGMAPPSLGLPSLTHNSISLVQPATI